MLSLRVVLGQAVAILVLIICLGLLGYHDHTRGIQLKVIEQTLTAKFEKEKADALAAAQAAYIKEQKKNDDQYQAAINNASKREQVLKVDRDSARSTANSLQSYLAGRVSELSTKEAAPVIYTVAVSDVLQHCTGEYQQLAATCDGHVSDIKTMIETSD